jgi:ubiquinol-cytochrome c reductase cytochrome b subunit
LLPFILAFLAIIHLVYLHVDGSNNPIGLNSSTDRVSFHTFYTSKDLFGFFFLFFLFFFFVFFLPNFLGDAENFIQANSLVTPVHIQPEWYFLFAYAILRSIPNKLGGVVAMFCSILILFFLAILHKSVLKGLSFRPLGRMTFWFLIVKFGLLT